MLDRLGPVEGAAYVPFIGNGDIAAELYTGREVYGADLDPKRVEVAASRLGGQVVVADCDRWPFDGVTVPFAVADFDAYAYPYDAFRAWWSNATKADRCVVFFTDGQRQAVKRTDTWHAPDGTRHDTTGDLTAKRVAYNRYWTTYVLPWIEGAAGGYRIVATDKYLRKDMLYWGAVIEREGTQDITLPTAVQTAETAVRASMRELRFAAEVNSGKSWPEAARAVGYKEEPSRVAHRCIDKGLIADPIVVAAEVRAGVQEGLAAIREGARTWLVGFLDSNREKIGNALVEAAESGNVPAIKEALDRLIGPEVQRVAPTDPSGREPWPVLDPGELAEWVNGLVHGDDHCD